MTSRTAILVPGNGKYFLSPRKINGKIHPFRREVYEYISKSGLLCEYIGYADIDKASLKKYKILFLLNIEVLTSTQKDTIKQYVKNGGHLIMTYKTSLAEEYGISFIGTCHRKLIYFKKEMFNYQIVNIDKIIYKINRSYLKGSLPIEKLLRIPAISVKPKNKNEVLATWGNENLSALLINKSYPGKVVYFSGILAGAENELLENILSLIKSEDSKPFAVIPNGKRCCLTIFHDYERECGNDKFDKYTDIGLNFILESQKRHNIKATFNIVGKIYESHPKTVRQIIRDGHEIACHTYKHEIPSKTKYKDLDRSIDLYLKTSEAKFNMGANRGFRSPESKWNADLIEILEKDSFLWNAEDEEASIPYNLVLAKRLRLVRIPIACDDYSYISRNTSVQNMLKKLKNTVEEGIKDRDFIAIGFHPWIEGMKEERLRAFEEFLSYLSTKTNVTIMPFGQVCNWWKNRNKDS